MFHRDNANHACRSSRDKNSYKLNGMFHPVYDILPITHAQTITYSTGNYLNDKIFFSFEDWENELERFLFAED